MIFYKVRPLSGSLQPTLFMPLRPNHIHIISKIWKKTKKKTSKENKDRWTDQFWCGGREDVGAGWVWWRRGGAPRKTSFFLQHRGSLCQPCRQTRRKGGEKAVHTVRLSQSFAMQKIITIFVKALSACLVNFSPLFSHCVVLFDLNPWRVNWLNDKWNDWSHLYWPDGCQRVQCQWLTFLVLFNLASS